MIPAVVFVVLFVNPIFSLPLSAQEFTTAGAQNPQPVLDNKEFVNPQATTNEKSQTEGASKITTGTNEGSFVETSAIKSGAEGIPAGVIQNADKAEHQDYSKLGETNEPSIIRGHSGIPQQYSGLETTSQVEQAGSQVPFTSHQYTNPPVPKGEDVAASSEQIQQYQPDNPLLLPIQPLTVVPVNQVGEFLKPVVVPADAVTAGRVIVMAIKPIQQRNFQDVSTVPEKQVPYQQLSQTVTYGPEGGQTTATGFGQPIEKEEIQRGTQPQITVQPQTNQVGLVKEQVLPTPDVVLQAVETVLNYVPAQAAEPSPQTFSAQPVQSVVNENVQKQLPQQSTGYTPYQTQFVEPAASQQQTQNAQQLTEKQGAFQEPVHDTVPHQVQTFYHQQNNPVAVESVQSPQPSQEEQQLVKRISDSTYQEQSVEGQTPYQQSSEYVPVQKQPLVQQVYSVQPESQQSHVPVETQQVQQKVSGGQSEYQESYIPVQTHLTEQTQTAYQSSEKQTPSQQPVQNPQYVQVYPSEQVPQQQKASNAQSYAGVQTPEVQTPFQPAQAETTVSVPQQVHKTSEKQPNRVVDAQPPQVVNYAEPVYNFGDKIPQNPTVQQSNPFTSCQQ